MKKLFLTMLVGLASYSGVYASSSEEAKDTNLIKDIEVLNTQNLEIIQNDKIDESDYNCVSSVKMKKGDGEAEFFYYGGNASSSDDCKKKYKAYYSLLEEQGYEMVGEPTHNYYG